jgi:hypothetical protein
MHSVFLQWKFDPVITSIPIGYGKINRVGSSPRDYILDASVSNGGHDIEYPKDFCSFPRLIHANSVMVDKIRP